MTTGLATRNGTTALDTSTDTWGLMRDQAAVLVKTGFLPAEIKSPEQALAIMLKGRELGIPTMYALSNIAVVKGKPTCSAELMLALIYRDHGDSAVMIDETNNKACRLRYKRKGWSQYQKHAFTIEEAQTAGLAGQDTWKKYPQALLRARNISSMARMAFPDSIGGMYTPEEMGASVFTADGETFEVAPALSAGGGFEDSNGHGEAPQPAEVERVPYETRQQHLARIAKESTSLLTTEQRDALKVRAAELGLPASPRQATADDDVLGWIALIEEATIAARPY